MLPPVQKPSLSVVANAIGPQRRAREPSISLLAAAVLQRRDIFYLSLVEQIFARSLTSCRVGGRHGARRQHARSGSWSVHYAGSRL